YDFYKQKTVESKGVYEGAPFVISNALVGTKAGNTNVIQKFTVQYCSHCGSIQP
ncbi:unnamed protein product, partial [Ceratitis capitata]